MLSTAETLADRIKSAREEQGLSQTELAVALKLTRGAVGQWETGETEPAPGNLRKAAKILKVASEWLGTGRGERYLERIPIEEFDREDQDPTPAAPEGHLFEIDVRAGMGGGGLIEEADRRGGQDVDPVKAETWKFPSTFLREEARAPATRLVVIETQGDSMAPTIQPGERVIVDTGHRLPSPDGIYALRDRFGAIVVKRLHSPGRGKSIKVISDNPMHPPEEMDLQEIAIVGRVVGGWKRY